MESTLDCPHTFEPPEVAPSGMTPREKFIMALKGGQPPGIVPTFELVFFLTEELLGKTHPSHMDWSGWGEKPEKEKEAVREECARIYIESAEALGHSAIFLHQPSSIEDHLRLIQIVREMSGMKYFLMVHGDATYAIPNGQQYQKFVFRLVDEPDVVKAEANNKVDAALERARQYIDGGLDGFALCADYCFNKGPFLSPPMFREFITPFLTRLVRGQRQMGAYVIKHTDGDIMPILEDLIEGEPHALHSLDPQAGVDIREVKELIGDRVCLIGNVDCGLMQTGTPDEVRQSAEYALEHGMPGGGCIFSTSNCIYPGLPLERYFLILEVWKEKGWPDQ